MVFKPRKAPKEPRNPVGTVAELFAGVGGFRIGLEAANWATIFSNQYEPATPSKQHASMVYLKKFPDTASHFNIDIAELIKQKEHFHLENNVDLVVGGFPCQDYSVAKSLTSAHGLEGKKGVLWWEIVKFIKKVKPSFVFLENVDRLLKSPVSQKGRDFAIMLRKLSDLGYFVEWRVVNSADYGFHQRRIRVFILARKLEITPQSWLENPNEVLSNYGVLARAFRVSETNPMPKVRLSGPLDKLSDSFGTGEKKSPWGNAGVYFNKVAYPANVVPKKSAQRALREILVPDTEVPEEYWITGKDKLEAWKATRRGSSKERTHASGYKYFYSEGSMPFPDSLDRPSRTILTAEGGSSPSRFKHIIETTKGFRRLLPVELERLNDFPPNWTEKYADGTPVADVKRAFFMGNALVVGLVEMVGKVLGEDYRQIRDARSRR